MQYQWREGGGIQLSGLLLCPVFWEFLRQSGKQGSSMLQLLDSPHRTCRLPAAQTLSRPLRLQQPLSPISGPCLPSPEPLGCVDLCWARSPSLGTVPMLEQDRIHSWNDHQIPLGHGRKGTKALGINRRTVRSPCMGLSTGRS